MKRNLGADRKQFGFQRSINTLQAALDIARTVESELGQMLAVLDLAKAYDRVIRRLLVKKVDAHGVPAGLVSQLILFMVPLLVLMAGYLTGTEALLTTRLSQGFTASPTLFRFFINDLAGDLREAVGENRESCGPSMSNPAKLVADDVILIGRSSEELRRLLEACTKWASNNRLEWKPSKCTIVAVPHVEALQPLWIAGQVLSVKEEAEYLSFTVPMTGLRKEVEEELKPKETSACSAMLTQKYFDSGLPNSTLCTFYRTNVRSSLLYGTH